MGFGAGMEENQYYKIGEVARKLGVETSVLRYWENEFPWLQPRRTSSGQRLYSEQDLQQAKMIYNLLYIEKMTIAGAKKRLELSESVPNTNLQIDKKSELLPEIIAELNRIRTLLK